MNLTYRRATEADFEFLFRLHEAAMRQHVEATFGAWDETWQREHFRKHFNPASIQVIQADGTDAGMLVVQERTEEIFLADLEILPSFQRRGIGTAVVRKLLEDAGKSEKPVALQVLKANIGARNLYQRLGFGITGQNETHYILAYVKRKTS